MRTESSDGIPLLSAKNIFNGEIRWNDFDRVPIEELNEFRKRVQLRRGDVLMTCVGSIGRAAVWPNERPVVLFRSVAIIRPKKTLKSEFLAYLIRSVDFQTQLLRRTKQSSQGGIYLKDIKAISVAVPPLAEQERIVKLLDEADELRKLRTQADRRTAALIPALFHEMFGDPEHTRLPVKPLVELVLPNRPITYGILKPGPNTVNGVPYVRVVDIKQNRLHVEQLLKTTQLIANQYKRSVLQPGDILITIRGTVGRTCLVPDELTGANITQDTARLAVIPEIESNYAVEFLNTPWAQNWMARHMLGQAVKGLNLGDLRKLPVPLPSLVSQKAFAARVAEIRELEAGQAASRQRLDALFQSMLHRAFNGEL